VIDIGNLPQGNLLSHYISGGSSAASIIHFCSCAKNVRKSPRRAAFLLSRKSQFGEITARLARLRALAG
jgi:hypothetical protein